MNFDESSLFIQEQIAKINELNQKINNTTSDISLLNKKIYQLNKQVKELRQQKENIEKKLQFEPGDIVYFKNDSSKKKRTIISIFDDGYSLLIGLSDCKYAYDADGLVLYKKAKEGITQ